MRTRSIYITLQICIKKSIKFVSKILNKWLNAIEYDMRTAA